MPEMNGLEATSIIKSAGYKMPIIALTAYAFQEEKELFIKGGMDGYLSKPIEFNALQNFLVNALKHKFSTKKMESQYKETLKRAEDSHSALIQEMHQSYDTNISKSAYDEAVKLVGGHDTLALLYAEMQTELEDILKRSQKHLLDKEFENLRREVHTVKGTSGSLGISTIYENAKDLEAFLKTEQEEKLIIKSGILLKKPSRSLTKIIKYLNLYYEQNNISG